MKIEKKAVFFTVVSIILVTSLMFFYISSNKYLLENKAKVIETRVMTMDSLIDDIEKDIERGLYISSMRSIIGIAEYLTYNGSFLQDFQSRFNEVMINGSIFGNRVNMTINATFKNWTDKIIFIAENLDVDVNFSGINLDIFQDDPWNIKVTAFGNMSLEDRKGIASWNRSLNVTALINIENFEDPLYTISSRGKLTNKIVKSNVTDFVSGDDASALVLHANQSWYIYSETAPNFIMRFSDNLSASPHGIESIVNVQNVQISAPEIYRSSISSVDYIYFNESYSDSCRINETESSLSWFRLDDGHLDVYEVKCI
jgi:hypothetical protein